ncbi:DNA-binding protein [Bacteroidia bacterium]|nr:DNA-binding protein [Bacteroidia bacterium]
MELQIIQNKIFEIRGFRVMLDFHLAEMYQVETRALNQSVKRNIERFPDDFMFALTSDEWESMSSQFVMTSRMKRPKSALPLVFTEQGIAMLSSVLRSQKAIDVNISIMRAFVLMRRMVIGYEELRKRIEELEINTDAQFSEIYQALTEFASKKEAENKPRRPIGYLSYTHNQE